MIWFVVFDTTTGTIKRFGTCTGEDLVLQQALDSETVLAFDGNPGVTDLTHTVDLATRALMPKEA